MEEESISYNENCYLTVSCVKYFQEFFKNDCYELTTLRWFGDHFFTKEEVDQYYRKSKVLVKKLDQDIYGDMIYDYIYDDVVCYCVSHIKDKDYEKACRRLRESFQALEDRYKDFEIEEKLENRAR